MPSVPIDIPSEIVIVLNITGFKLFDATPELTESANLFICELHGVTCSKLKLFQLEIY